MVVLGGDMNFRIVDGFVMDLETGFPLSFMNVNGLGEAEMLREPMDSNRSFPVMSTLKIVLAAFEIFRHMLHFISSKSWLGLGVAYLWLGNMDDHICYKFC